MTGPLGLWTVTFLLGLRKIMMIMMSSKQIWQKVMRKVSLHLAAVKNMKGTNNGQLSTANKRGAISKSTAKRVQALFDPEERRATAQRLIDKEKAAARILRAHDGDLDPKERRALAQRLIEDGELPPDYIDLMFEPSYVAQQHGWPAYPVAEQEPGTSCHSAVQLHEPPITVQHHDASSYVVQQHKGPAYSVAEQQGPSFNSATAYEESSYTVQQPSYVVQQHEGPPYYAAEQQQGAYHSAVQLYEPSITVQHHDAPSLVVQQHNGPPYSVAEQQQGASYHSATAYEDHSAVVHENDLRKNGNYRMAGGGFENPDYEGTPGDDADFIDANETTPFVPTSSSTPAPLQF